MKKVIWKVNCLVHQGNKLIGYDMVSITGEKRTVTPQELYNAVVNGAVANAVFRNGGILVQESVQKRFIEEVINIQLKASEFRLLYEYISNLYDRLLKDKNNDSEKMLQVLQHFNQAKHYAGM